MAPKLGIIAGAGVLPGRVIESCRRAGREFFVIAITGYTDPAILAGNTPHQWAPLGAVSKTFKTLNRENCGEVVMVGAVRRPRLIELIHNLPILARALCSGIMTKGDNALLSKIVDVFENKGGFRMVGVHQLLPELLAPIGLVGSLRPDDTAREAIGLAALAALELGRRDIGQGVVAAAGRIIAREGAAGTDAMLATLDERARGGVLVKMAKPGQDRRVDLPTIGERTVKAAAAAGLKGIAVEAGGAIITDRAAVAAAADQAGLFVVGIDPEPYSKSVPRVYLIAGEDSGDRLGASLMASLNEKTAGHIHFSGIGGEAMTAAGLESLFPMRELAVMGLSEVLPKIPRLLWRIYQTVRDIRQTRPDLVVTIDAPDFVFRVGARIKAQMASPPPIVHYVAPSVWAWRPGRAKKVARFLDHILCLLPFEPPYFARQGLAATFVGHPVVESDIGAGDGAAFRARHAIGPRVPLLLALPGSRSSEIALLAGVFGETVGRVRAAHPELACVVVAVEHQMANLRHLTRSWPVPTVVVGGGEKGDAFAAADVALAASGTVALELAAAGVPNVIAYRVRAMTEFVGKLLVKTRFASLVNLVLDRAAVPELLFANCRADTLAREVGRLFDDPAARDAQQRAFAEALVKLGKGSHSPAGRAADVVLGLINKEKKT